MDHDVGRDIWLAPSRLKEAEATIAELKGKLMDHIGATAGDYAWAAAGDAQRAADENKDLIARLEARVAKLESNVATIEKAYQRLIGEIRAAKAP